MNITIPYGNYGEQKRSYRVIKEYRSHFLFFDGVLKIANGRGLVLNRHPLNSHLPDISEETFEMWVDWVCSLPDDMMNGGDGKSAPNATLMSCRTSNFLQDTTFLI